MVNVLLDPLIDLFVSVWVAVFVVTVSEPTVADVILKAPPVTVFPVNVNALGKDSVTDVVPVEVISPVVPETEVTAPIELALMATFPAKVS